MSHNNHPTPGTNKDLPQPGKLRRIRRRKAATSNQANHVQSGMASGSGNASIIQQHGASSLVVSTTPITATPSVNVNAGKRKKKKKANIGKSAVKQNVAVTSTHASGGDVNVQHASEVVNKKKAKGHATNMNVISPMLDEDMKKNILAFVTSTLDVPKQMNTNKLLKMVHKRFKLNFSQLSPKVLVHQILHPTLVFYQSMTTESNQDGSLKKVFTLHYDPERIYKLPNLQRRKYRNVWRFNSIKTGTRPGESVKFPTPLESYALPDKIKNILDNKKILEKHSMNSQLKSALSGELKKGGQSKTAKEKPNDHVSSNEMFTYTHKFLDTLLHIEESQMIYDIKQFDLSAVTLENVVEKYRHGRNSKHYKVYCAGLAEKRPSVLRGDLILCRPHHETKARTVLFKGFIHYVNLDHVIVSFHENVEQYEKVDISFRFSRTPIKLMHRALSMCDTPYFEKVFSGTSVPSKNSKKHIKLPVNSSVPSNSSSTTLSDRLNQCQKTALIKLFDKPTTPQIIFGPPGCGKTFLVSQCILEIMKQDPKHKILVCAPSNQAADIIVERLVDTKLNPLVKMMRMNGAQRDPKTFTKWWIEKFSNKLVNGFEIPNLTEISKHDVIISTCASSGYLFSMGVKPGYFSHIIIDESGESVIPEALIPLSMKDDKTVIILAGDPKQLGPIVRSPLAVEFGLGESLLEHLVKIGDSCCTITQLQQSYRAHPKIMNVYSSVFYNNSLISSCTDLNSANMFINNPILKNPLVPMMFHHVKGDEKRDNDSPSWYNSKEIQVVMDQVNQVVNSGLLFNSSYDYDHEIGIITPYRKQAEEIKKLLRQSTNPLYKHIFVGTTEQFQGQERRVIILTTVRSSSAEGKEQDSKFKLGFLQNPKRLNVAISRAISLMIVVGNAELLSADEYWKKIIDIYMQEGCFNEHDKFTPPPAKGGAPKKSGGKSKARIYNTESLEIKRYE